MTKLVHFVRIAIGLTVLVLILDFAQPRPIQAAPNREVTVDNTTANPVPVTTNPRLTHMGRLPSEHVLLTLSTAGLFNYDTPQGVVYPFTVPANQAFVA